MVQKRLSGATKKRLRAARMRQKGNGCAEAALAVGVARQTVYTWKALLDEEQLASVRATILQRPTEHGFGAELWTLKGIGTVVERLYCARFSEGHVWRILCSLGFSAQKPQKRAIERNEDAVCSWKRRTWPAPKKRPSETAG